MGAKAETKQKVVQKAASDLTAQHCIHYVRFFFLHNCMEFRNMNGNIYVTNITYE